MPEFPAVDVSLVEEVMRLRATAEREQGLMRLLISNNGKRQRRLEKLREALKSVARARTLAGAQSMARAALSHDVAQRRHDCGAPPARPSQPVQEGEA